MLVHVVYLRLKQFCEIGQIFHNEYIFDNKKNFPNIIKILPISGLNDSETQERGLTHKPKQ